MPASLDEVLESHRTHRPIVMGVLNVTPDSFSDGGRFYDPGRAVEQARRMAGEGVDIIDVGAESTRPGSQRVSPAEQIARLREVLPAVADLGRSAGRAGPLVSIDTTRREVAEFALSAGTCIINDVSAGRDDPGILALAASSGAGLVLMHMLGDPSSMQDRPRYRDVLVEVREFLSERLAAAEAAGADRRRCIVDPGIGFGKRLEHNLALIAGVGALCELGRPVMIGPSRKRFIGELTGESEPDRRGAGTIAACLAAWTRGATVFRVHDVGETVQALAVAAAIEKASQG